MVVSLDQPLSVNHELDDSIGDDYKYPRTCQSALQNTQCPSIGSWSATCEPQIVIQQGQGPMRLAVPLENSYGRSRLLVPGKEGSG